MSSNDLIDQSFMLTSIFPNLSFDGLNISSDKNFGFCNKFLFKNNTFVFADFSIKITDYLFEKVHFSLESDQNNKREIQVEHGKIKLHLVSNRLPNSNVLNSNLKIIFKQLDVDLCINDEIVLTIQSSNSTVDIEQQKTIEVSFSSCYINSKDEEILKKSDIRIKINNDDRTFLCTSDNLNVNCPLFVATDLFKRLYSILNSLTLTLTFTKIQLSVNKDTFIVANNFSLVYNSQQYSLTSRNCYLYLSSFVFLLKEIFVNQKGISIQDVELQHLNCSFQKIKPSTGPFLSGSYKNEQEFNMIINPIESNFDLIQFELFLDNVLFNSFIDFFMISYSDTILNVNFREIRTKVKINEMFIFSVQFNANISIQADSVILTSTDLKCNFNDNPPISPKQVFQYVYKKPSGNNKSKANILLSPLHFNLSSDEISPFLDLIGRIKKPLGKLFIKKDSEITVEMNEILVSIGQTIIGSNERSNFIQIKIEGKQIQIVVDDNGLSSSNITPTISVEFFNPLTSFWDSIVHSFNAHIVSISDYQMKHISITVDPQLSMNISTLFLSSLVNVLKSPTTSQMPICLISNYTNVPICIYEQSMSTDKIIIQPLQSHPLLNDTFYFKLTEQKFVEMFTTCITDEFFLKNDLIVNVELKDGVKNIYFMALWSIENQLGTDIRIFHKVKRAMLPILDLKNNEKKGLPPGLNWTLNYSVTSINNEKGDPNNTFIPKKYKFINYVIKNIENGHDGDALIILTKNRSDKAKVLKIYSRYTIKNSMPFEISILCHHLKANSALKIDANSEQPLLMPCDLNQPFDIILRINNDVSKPTTVNLKDISSKPIEYLVHFEKCSVKLNVCIGESVPSFNFHIYSPMIICNRSSMSFTVDKILVQSSKTYSLPLIEFESSPAILINDISKGPPVITIPATSIPVQIPMKNVNESPEQSAILMLPMAYDNNLLTPVLKTIKKIGDNSFLVYLDDCIIIKNNTKKTITIRIGNEFKLSFTPKLHAPISMANIENIFQLEISNYKVFGNVYFTYLVDTVLRFVSDEKKNPHSKNELYIRMKVSDNENKSKLVEFSEVTIESAPYLIVNNTVHIVYAQQTDDWLPMEIKAYSASICAFDDPFSESIIVLFIQGKSVAVNYSSNCFNEPLPFMIDDKFLYITVRTIETGQRVIFVDENKHEAYFDFDFSITIPITILTILNNQQELFITTIIGPTKFNAKTENGQINGNLVIQFIQALDNTEKVAQALVLSNEVEEKSNFLNLTFTMPITQSISLAKMTVTSIKVLPICVQVNNSFLNELLQIWKETQFNIKTIMHRIVQNHLPVFSNSILIFPIKFDLFYRKDATETVFLKQIGEHKPIQQAVPSLSTGSFPLIYLNNVSCTFNNFYDLLSEIYKNFLFKFLRLVKGKVIYNVAISYPHSVFQKLSLDKSDVQIHSVHELIDPDLQELHRDDKRLSLLSIQDNEEYVDHLDSNAMPNSLPSNNSNVNFGLLDSVNANSSAHFSIPFASAPTIASMEGDFLYIRDESQINAAYSKMPSKIEYQKYFFLKRMTQIDGNLVNSILSASKKKKSLVLIQEMPKKDCFLVVYEDCYDVVINADVQSTVMFSSIQEVNRENKNVKIMLIPEKPKLPAKTLELSFETNHTAETITLVINSQRERLLNK